MVEAGKSEAGVWGGWDGGDCGRSGGRLFGNYECPECPLLRSREQIKRMLDPSRVFHAQIKSEVETYERLKRGEFDELHNLGGIGPLLIGARIASGLSQRELAERLGVHESQVSPDERNEYHGVTVDRANRILEVLGVDVTTRVERVGKRR